MPLKLFKGFTLAEVLITLGIIGVVASLTIPGVMSAYNRHITETRLRGIYSTLQQAFRMYQAQFVEIFPLPIPKMMKQTLMDILIPEANLFSILIFYPYLAAERLILGGLLFMFIQQMAV